MRSRHAILSLSAIALFAAISPEAIAQSPSYAVKIEAGDAANALNALAMQTQHPILFDYDQVRGKRVNALEGNYTLEQALELILSGSGISGSLTEREVISISLSLDQTPESENNNMNLRPKNTLMGGVSAALLTALVSPQSASAQTADSNAGLEEIVVSAQKREQSAQDVPITVEAIDGFDLQSKGIDNLFDLAAVVPGIVFSRAPDDGLALTVRGLGTAARTQSFDQSVALFLDGMFVGKGRMYSGAFFDVDRVEVIKGTQSTLLGKNTSLGAISLVTNKPGTEFGGNLSVSYDVTYGGYIADAGIDIPINDSFSIRAAGHLVDRNGWVENVETDTNSPRDKEVGARITALFTPTDYLDITAMYQHSDFEREGNGYQFVSDDPSSLPAALTDTYGEFVLDDIKRSYSERAPGGESFHDTEVDSLSLSVNVDALGHTFTSITSSAIYDLDFVDDFDFGVLPATVDNATPSTDFTRVEEYKQFSQEFRIASPAGQTLEYLGGIFYFNSEWDSLETQIYETPFNPTPDPLSPVEIFNGTFANDFSQKTETFSLFGSATYNVTDQLRVTGGLRYTDETKDHTFGREAVVPTFWTTVVNPPFAATNLPFSDDFLNGNGSIQYDLNPDVMVYASYGVGTKTGGFAESAAVPTGDPLNEAFVDSETATSYELGIKSTLLDGAARFNAAVFLTEVENFQETSFSGSSFDTINSQVSAPGAEASLLWRFSDALTLDTAFSYVDSEVEAGQFLIGGALTDFDPRKPAQSPELTGHLGLIGDFQVSSDWDLNGSAYLRHRSEMVHQYVETFRSDALTTLDARLGVTNPEWGLGFNLIGTNLTNEISADFSGPPATAGIVPPDVRAESPTRLRTVMLQVTKEF